MTFVVPEMIAWATQDHQKRAEILRLLRIQLSLGGSWREFIQRLNAWRDVAAALHTSTSTLSEAISTVAIYLESGLAFEPWPREWLSYKHGETDENPHVWYDLPTDRITINVRIGRPDDSTPRGDGPPPPDAPLGSFYYRTDTDTQYVREADGWEALFDRGPQTFEGIPDAMCTCGKRYRVWKAEQDEIERAARAFAEGGMATMEMMIAGLIKRDVQ